MTTGASWVEIGRNPEHATTRDNATGIHTLRVDTTSSASGSTNSDGVAVATTGVVPSQSFNYVWNGTTWDRTREATADSLAVTGIAAIASMVWTGAVFNRLGSVNSIGDAHSGVQTPTASPMLFNGATYDRSRGNVNSIVRTMTAAVLGTTNNALTNYNARGIKLAIVLATMTTASITVTIEAVDASGNVSTLLASAAITSAGTTILTVYPGITASANVSASDVAPRALNIKSVISDNGGAAAVTGTINASLIV